MGDPPQPPASGPKRWIVAGAAAAVLVVAVVVVLALTALSSDDAGDAYQERVAQVMQPVIDANERLSNRLSALRGRRVASARDAVRAARDATVAAQGGLTALTVPDGQQQAATNARGTLTRERAYLDAVDAALANPASGSAEQTQTLAANLTDALNTISPPGENWAASVQGAAQLTTWAARMTRRSERRRERARDDAGGSTPAPAPAPPSRPVTGTDCGDGVIAGPNTSCPFARNVRDAYYDAPGTVATVDVYSPVTGRTYTMSCAPAGSGISCAGGNDASVSFR